MHSQKPEIAKKWDAEMKGKPHKSKIRSAAKKAFGGKY